MRSRLHLFALVVALLVMTILLAYGQERAPVEQASEVASKVERRQAPVPSEPEPTGDSAALHPRQLPPVPSEPAPTGDSSSSDNVHSRQASPDFSEPGVASGPLYRRERPDPPTSLLPPHTSSDSSDLEGGSDDLMDTPDPEPAMLSNITLSDTRDHRCSVPCGNGRCCRYGRACCGNGYWCCVKCTPRTYCEVGKFCCGKGCCRNGTRCAAGWCWWI